MRTFIDFVHELEKHGIAYDLEQTRDNYVLLDIGSPGKTRSVEFSADGDVVVKGHGSLGDVEGAEILEFIFNNYSL